MTALEVRDAGLLTLVQDQGRRGQAHLGVPRAGALDTPAAALANRLVGNSVDAAVLEVVGGLEVVVTQRRWVAAVGAAGVTVHECLEPGRPWRMPAPVQGLRSCLGVAGGIDVPPVLGSRSTDTLAWVGPPPVRSGDRLPLGEPTGGPVFVDVALPRHATGLRVLPGPRAGWFPQDVLDRLTAQPWTVQEASNRVGLRLDGPPLRRRPDYAGRELPSEGMVLGAVQVPPDGRPVVFLADHPPTGGYPVVGVVESADLWQCAHLRPGEEVRFVRG